MSGRGGLARDAVEQLRPWEPDWGWSRERELGAGGAGLAKTVWGWLGCGVWWGLGGGRDGEGAAGDPGPGSSPALDRTLACGRILEPFVELDQMLKAKGVLSSASAGVSRRRMGQAWEDSMGR